MEEEFHLCPTLCLCSIILFPWGSRKNELQTGVSDSDCTLCWCCELYFPLIKGLLKSRCARVLWLLLLSMSSSRLLLICLFPDLYQCYTGVRSHLRRRTLYSPTALVKHDKSVENSFILCSMTLQLTCFNEHLKRKPFWSWSWLVVNCGVTVQDPKVSS